jgi:hypothetical protein
MSGSARRAARMRRRGGALPACPAAALIAADAELAETDARLVADGWTRPASARRYVTRAGTLTVRLVWRKRAEGLSRTHEIVYRMPMEILNAEEEGNG